MDDLLLDFKLGLKKSKEEMAQELQTRYTRYYELITKLQNLEIIRKK